MLTVTCISFYGYKQTLEKIFTIVIILLYSEHIANLNILGFYIFLLLQIHPNPDIVDKPFLLKICSSFSFSYCSHKEFSFSLNSWYFSEFFTTYFFLPFLLSRHFQIMRNLVHSHDSVVTDILNTPNFIFSESSFLRFCFPKASFFGYRTGI